MNIEEYIITDKDVLTRIERAYLELLSHSYSEGFLATDKGRKELDDIVFGRYNYALEQVVPWVAGQIDLAGKIMVEIGCGTASSTAAFSHFVETVDGYDIVEPFVQFAKKRLAIMNIDNARVCTIKNENLCATLLKKHGSGVDIILLFAVLEHQTVEERIETIKTCWELLNHNGIMVISDTPNLLTYHDEHTSELPFLHLLPDATYKLYAPKSSRQGFRDHFIGNTFNDREKLYEAITRWGRGVSYHDFELSLGENYRDWIVASGFEKEFINRAPVSLEEEILRLYIRKKKIDIPPAFTRSNLNFILRKGNGTGNREVAAPPEFTMIADAQQLDRLSGILAAREQELSEVYQSKRWMLGSLLAWPYRKIRHLFN
jgi:S-adenosylmethionine-dependent methyltransferase